MTDTTDHADGLDGVGGVDLDTVDFFRDPSVVADPHPYFDHLRSRCPVHREPNHSVFMVTGYDEACAVYTDPDTFSSCNSVTGPFPGFPVPVEGVSDDVSELIERHRDELPFSDQLPTMDPPEHKAHRGLLMRLLTPKRLRENEEFMWRRVDGQIDEFLARGTCELVWDFAKPFTLYVVADLLGVPESEQEELRGELQGGSRRNAVLGRTDAEMRHAPLQFLYDRFTTYVEERRREPRNDVMTGLATATFPDGSLPEVIDVVRIATNLFTAGQDTTVRLLTTMLQIVAEHPDVQQALRDDRERIPDFVEECLRIESPVKGDFRLARRSTSVGGVDIPAGSTVMVLNGAASRDPRRFEDPGEVRVDRRNAREHLAFGRGIHACPGGPLARSEARVSLHRLLDRMQDIRISEAEHGPPGARRYDYDPTFILRGLTLLHLTFTPT